MSKPIYLDYNATTPIAPEVAEAMRPFIYEHFGNPSSTHAFGVAAKKGVEKARRQVAEMLGCEVDEVIFTSGGSESNNMAIKGIAYAYRDKGNHIITSAVEHPAVMEVVKFLKKQGFTITILPVDEYGLVNPGDVESSVTSQTILITIMHANNEVGTIQPIKDIAAIAHAHGALMHTDAAQSVGKITVQVNELGVDLLSIAGHKFYAPKGVGALYLRSGVKLQRLVHGAEHEMNMRAGTENVIEIVGLGTASELVSGNLESYSMHMHTMHEQLERRLRERFPDLRINGHPEKRLPNTTSVSFRGLEANTILAELETVAASAGAACHADRVEISQVLSAMDVPLEYAMGTIRLTVGRTTTTEEIDRAVDEISQVVEGLQPQGQIKIASTMPGKIKLTQFTHGLGCACKLRPQLLEKVLKNVPLPQDKRILVGTETGDDAAVYLINNNTALVQTVDFFTPIVDDAFQFGAISAANSLSDVYAMGAKPLFALNIVGFPSNRLPLSVLEEILRGAQSKAEEAGIAVIGGHTVDDTEPKYGMAVTGVVASDCIITNSHAQPGDVLVLTKPIGTGILTTALKQGLLEEHQQQLVIATMSALNRAAAEAMQKFGAHACTDVTGFGLVGHLLGMMRGSNTSAIIYMDSVPILPGAFELATSGVVPGGTKNNQDYTAPYVHYAEGITHTNKVLLNDAQTSGGLLISLSADKAHELIAQLGHDGVQTVQIGEVMESKGKIRIVVR
ncbi:MAG TPA: selenide, water dikinase SelD [Anaerolineae bacterium]|nr:selenide, water dikinase SelD [Anaerolineae bacterium]